MKATLLKLSVVAALMAPAFSYGQDVSIVATSQPYSIGLGDTGLIKIDIINNDPAVAVAVNKLRPLVSIPSAITAIPNSPTTASGFGSNPDGWTVMTNDGQSMRVTNANAIAPNTTSTYYIKIVGTATGGPQTITTTIAYNGPQTINNDPSNDNDTASITVTTPLPVVLTSFTAAAAACQAELTWNTGTEAGFHHFDVERSRDGKIFERIGSLAALGSNSRYTFTDVHPLEGSNQYRLKMTDMDGSAVISPCETVSIRCDQNEITVFPNPATDKVQLKMTGYDSVREVKLLDMRGREVYRSADASAPLSLKGLASGTYLLQVERKDGSMFRCKVAKQ